MPALNDILAAAIILVGLFYAGVIIAAKIQDSDTPVLTATIIAVVLSLIAIII